MSQEVHHGRGRSRSLSSDSDHGKPDPIDMDANVLTEACSSPGSDGTTVDGDLFGGGRAEVVDCIMRSLCAALDSKLAVVKQAKLPSTAKQRLGLPPGPEPKRPALATTAPAHCAATYIPQGDTYGEGVGIPGLGSIHDDSRSTSYVTRPFQVPPPPPPYDQASRNQLPIPGAGAFVPVRLARTGRRGGPIIRLGSPTQIGDVHVSVQGTTPSTATPQVVRGPHAHLVEEDMTEEESRRLEAEGDGVPGSNDQGHIAHYEQMDRHHEPKRSEPSSAPMFGCLFKPCPYKYDRESKCRQHMEQAHGWTYVRAKRIGKAPQYMGAQAAIGDAVQQQGTSTPAAAGLHAGDDTAGGPASTTTAPVPSRPVNDGDPVLYQPTAAPSHFNIPDFHSCSPTLEAWPPGDTSMPPPPVYKEDINWNPTPFSQEWDHFAQPRGLLDSPAADQTGLSTTASASSVSSTVQPELAAQWQLEKVLLWLQAYGFSTDWQEAFKSLNICGEQFLNLSNAHGGHSGRLTMHYQVYPQLARECKKRGTEWNQNNERAEGKRIRRLIMRILDPSNGGAGSDKPPALTGGVTPWQEGLEFGVLPMLTRKMISVEPSVEDGDGDGRRKKARRGSSVARVAGGSVSGKFACPYFKRNPKKYRKWTSCPGPGWDEVHRAKTHLYRRHQLPIQCPRCWTVFKTDDQRQSHLQQDPPCAVQPNQTLYEGFTKDQEKRLRSRKKTQADTTDEAKWREIYMILFPDDDVAAIPSPYYDESDANGEGGSTSSGSGEFEDYATFIRREMPTLVRRELEVLFRDEFRDVEERLRPRMAEIVLNLQLRLLSLYKQSQMPLSEYGPAQHGDMASGGEKTSTPSLSQVGSVTGSGTNSTPTTLPGVKGSLVEAETQPDWYDGIWDTDCDAGYFGSQVLAQVPSETGTCPGLDWEHEFDTLLDHVLPPVDIQTGYFGQPAQASAQGG